MLNSFLSKASQGTNESNKEQGGLQESAAVTTLSANQDNNEATGTYPSPGSSPYQMGDEDDTPVLVARYPSASPVPHVVEGSLTYDNLQTTSDISDGASDSAMKVQDDNAKKTGDIVDEIIESTKKALRDGFEDKAFAEKLFADSVIVEPGSGESEEGKDQMKLSLHASELDISAIKDLTITTPSNVEANKDLVVETEIVDNGKVTSDLKDKTVAKETKLPQSDKDSVQRDSKESELSRTDRRLLLLPFLLATPLLVYCARRSSDSIPSKSPIQEDDTHKTAHAGSMPIVDASVADDNVKAGNEGVANEIDSSIASENSTVPVSFGNTRPDVLAEKEVIAAANTSSIIAEKHETQEKMELPETRSRISVSVATDDTPTIKSLTTHQPKQASQDFLSLKAEDNTLRRGSTLRHGMSMPQLLLLAVVLLATRSMLGSKSSKVDQSIKKEFTHIKQELRGYDLSKYINDLSAVQLREMLRARKCNTEGKKHKLAQRLAAVYKAELETLTVVKLRKILKRKNFTQYGTKAEIIRVLVEECP